MNEKARFFVAIVFFLILVLFFAFSIYAILEYNNWNDKKLRIEKIILNRNDTTDLPIFNNMMFNKNNLLINENIKYACQLIQTFESSENITAKITYNSQTIGIIISTDNDNIWIVFRGTQTAQEWHKDLLFEQVLITRKYLKDKKVQKQIPFLKSKVHLGFLEIYLAIRTQLLKIDYINKNVYVTGHSLGGALSLLTTLEFDVKETWVFGCPRVGDETFRNLFSNKKVTRIENRSDMVCNLPLAVSPNFIGDANDVFLYSHVGDVIEFEDNLGSFFRNHRLETYLSNL